MKILLTDACYKHSLAIAKYIKLHNPKIGIVGIINNKNFKSIFLYFLYKHIYSKLILDNLKNVLDNNDFDLVIPVGALSVKTVAEHKTSKKYLANLQNIELCLDKKRTMDLAQSLDIPTPKTIYIDSKKDIKNINIDFPCVIKGNSEINKIERVKYIKNKTELKKILNKLLKNRNIPLIIQEYIVGIGAGFFGFYQNGHLKRFYIHKRLREYPITGGPSTAAETFYHPKIFEYGKKLLDKLQWNGVAMVEFKYNKKLDKIWLIEINPKFWGSTELGLTAGINFGALIIKAFKEKNINIDISPESYKRIKFYWPLDGDILSILKSKKYKSLFEYFKRDYKTNLDTNGLLINLFKCLNLLKKILKK